MKTNLVPVSRFAPILGILTVFLAAWAGPAWGATLDVGSGHTYATINGALSASSAGDTIEVYSGTYNEKVHVTTAAQSNLTIRAAAGQSVILDAGGIGGSSVTLRSSVVGTVFEGFTILYRASGAPQAFDTLGGSGQIFRNNTLVGYSNVAGVQIRNANVQIVGNTFSDFVGSYNGGGAQAVLGESEATGLIISNNVMSNFSSRIAQEAVINVLGANSRVVNNTIKNYGMDATFGTAAISIRDGTAGNGILIANNYVVAQANTNELNTTFGIEIEGGANHIINNNRISSGNRSIDILSTASTNITVANNVMDTFRRSDFPHTVGAGVASDQGIFQNNLFLANDAAMLFLTGSESNSASGNSFVGLRGAGGSPYPMYGAGGQAGSTNTFQGNFFTADAGGNAGTGQAAPVIIPTTAGPSNASNTSDSAAIGGFWARGTLITNVSSITVGHAADTNRLGQQTKAVFDTTRGAAAPTLQGQTNFAYLVHLLGDTRTSTNGLVMTNHLHQVLQLAQPNQNGEFFATIQMAFDTNQLVGMTASNLAFFAWNASDYANQTWQLAVQGNITNAYFTANTVSMIWGAPTSVLGNYGVDTVNNVAWANVNYAADFAVFAVPEPTALSLGILVLAGLLARRRGTRLS